MQRNLTFQPITMPYFKYDDIATTKKLDNKIKTLKYGAFPDIAGYDEPATLFIVEMEFPFRAIPSQRNIPFRADNSA